MSFRPLARPDAPPLARPLVGPRLRRPLAGVLLCTLLAGPTAVLGQAKPDAKAAAAPAAADPHRQGDIGRHRAIAAAHAAAADCLEAGRDESQCHAALRKACEGIAVGRYCGMKHVH